MSVQFSKEPNEGYNPYSAPTADMSDDEYFEYDTTPFYKSKGRIGRVRFLAYTMMLVLCLMLAMFVVGVLSAILLPALNEGGILMMLVLYFLVWVIALYANFAPSMRRLNDLNRTSWIALLYLIPIINILLWLYLSLAPGDEGVNDYGAPAKPPSTLMIVLAVVLPLAFVGILGVLAAIALPAYHDYVERSKLQQEAQIEQVLQEAQNQR